MARYVPICLVVLVGRKPESLLPREPQPVPSVPDSQEFQVVHDPPIQLGHSPASISNKLSVTSIKSFWRNLLSPSTCLREIAHLRITPVLHAPQEMRIPDLVLLHSTAPC